MITNMGFLGQNVVVDVSKRPLVIYNFVLKLTQKHLSYTIFVNFLYNLSREIERKFGSLVGKNVSMSTLIRCPGGRLC